jgi:uncharacterized protein
MRIERGLALTLPDGCRLVTDIYRPPGAGRVPAVLERTPYGRGRCNQAEIPYGASEPRSREALAQAFVARGYALVVQDCRGSGDSTGVFEKYVHEAEDGLHTQAWIAAQPWCDGRIATMGFSYAAMTQLATACLGAPHLRAMFLDSGGFFDAHASGIRWGGAFELKQATWAFLHAQRTARSRGDEALAARLAAENLHAWLRRTPWQPGASPIAAMPDQEAMLLDYWNTETFGDFWRQPCLYARGAIEQLRKIPMLLLSSWFDTSLPSTINLWWALRNAGADAPLVIGPWTHGNRHQSFAGELDLGPQAHVPHPSADLLQWRLDWFDAVLHYQPGEAPAPRVRYFEMGGGSGVHGDHGRRAHGGCWRSSAQWPPPSTRALALHLHADGLLHEVAPPQSQQRAFTSNPNHPVATRGGAINSGEPLMEGGAFAHPAQEPGVLVFQTSPLTRPLRIAGSVLLQAQISIDTPDADLCVRLLDVYPDGVAYKLTDGVLRLSHREAGAELRALSVGEPVRIRVHAYPTAHQFAAGHRIRLDVAGSNFPRWDLNPQNDPRRRDMQHARTAQITLHLGGPEPACLQLQAEPEGGIDEGS